MATETGTAGNLRYLLMSSSTSRVWHGLRYLVVSTIYAVLAWLVLLIFGGVLFFFLFGVGVLALPETVLLMRWFAGRERRRAATVLGAPVHERYVPLHDDSVLPLSRVRRVVSDPATWRDLAWLFTHAVAGFVPLVLFLVLWMVALTAAFGRVWLVPIAVVVTLWSAPRLAWLQAAYSRLLLKPSPKARLAERVEELTATRADALDAHGSELRRIERDLHDGTQARLTSLALRLGVAEEKFASDPDGAARLVQEARDGATEALTELRDVVRGIYPPILSDRGLTGATEAIAANCTVPVTVRIEDIGRLPAAVEAATYFVITEALTNATRHSAATRSSVDVTRGGASLVVEVRDDGHGGADESRGSGLAGIRQRVAAFDGDMRVSSPAGGPTVLLVEIPCGS